MIDVETSTALASVEAIRAQFPALAREHHGKPVAYFDGPGGTQVPERVAESVTEYLIGHNANTHWAYPTSAETDDILARARTAFGDLLGCDSSEIVFGANMTTLTFHLARSLGRGLGPGDEIVVTELDHHANIDPWVDLASERDLKIRRVRMDPATGCIDLASFEASVNERTRIVAIGAASNALGTVNDLAGALGVARQVSALTFVDAVHSAPHLPTDVSALGCDFLVCSAYKFYGPHIGALYGRRELIERLSVPRVAPAADGSPERLETGTLNHEGVAGAMEAIDFLASLAPGESRRKSLTAAFTGLHQRGEFLVRRLWDGLAAIDGVRLYGPPPGDPRTATVAFTLSDLPSSQVAASLARHHSVFVSHGDFYAATVVDRLGVAGQGLVRAGCACYTTESEVDRLASGVREIAAGS